MVKRVKKHDIIIDVKGTEYKIAKIFNAINVQEISVPLKTVVDNSFYFEEFGLEEENI